MDRSFFRRSSRDDSPLLPRHASKSYPLDDLSPRPYSDSPSPSPSRRSQGSNRNSPPIPSQRSHVMFAQPPPPIATSLLLNAPQPSSSRSVSPSLPISLIKSTVSAATNPLTSLSRRAKAIQSDLQLLLDAQSVGLVQGRIGDQGDDRSSDAGSRTPTSRSIALSRSRSREDGTRSGSGVVPVRQPRKKRIGLKSARKGILSAMEELSTVKRHEEAIIDTEIDTVQFLVSQVSLWEKKISSFEQEMKRIIDGTEGREILELKTERSAVSTEIRELEERLLSLRARERHLERRIEEVGNRREAEMSSFREGKRGVESEVKEFLRRPPVLEVAVAVTTKSGTGCKEGHDIKEEAFLTLPPKRRTLEMAKDWLTSTHNILSAHRDSISTEKEALNLGASIWSDTISLVTSFEEDLRHQIKSGSQLQIPDLKDQLARMEKIVWELEKQAKTAEEKRWNLLICAIGAELEAFREGEGLLRGVLETLDPGQGLGIGAERGSGLVALDAEIDGHGDGAGYHEDGNDNGNGIIDNDDVGGRKLLGQHNTDGFGDVDTGPGVGGQGEGNDGKEKGNGFDELGLQRERKRNPSPYRSETEESEDDGPPKALLVGVEEEDDD